MTSTEYAIEIEGLSKRYRLGQSGHKQLLGEALRAFGKRYLGKEVVQTESIWALRDVTLKVRCGEVLGIIGRNGSGKSTLLKVLSRITRATSGQMCVNGRVAALLEVGTGFHEELTGRENVFLNGAILGMTRREMIAKLDEIIAFAGVEKFVDTPIKRYSSGMRLRLGFAIAAHLEPAILMVDEVLAVGDAGFQRKCLKAMDDMQSRGKTVLFVSHNLSAIDNLCSRVIWVNNGRIEKDGPPADIIRAYLSSFPGADNRSYDFRTLDLRRGNGDVRLTHMEFMTRSGEPKTTIFSGDPLIVRLHYEALHKIAQPHFGFKIYTETGDFLTEISTWGTGFNVQELSTGPGQIDLAIDFLNLMPGRYLVSLWIEGIGPVWYDVLEHCASFDVEASNYYNSGRGIESRFGLIFLPGCWSWDATGIAPRTVVSSSESG
jgi:lipopolysaccharide transport system ATP-binding protein